MTEDELIEAVRAAVSDRGLPPPASPADVARAEAAIGHTLPHLLRRLYLEVADGGFGIWQCVSLTDNGEWYSDEQDIIEVHRSWASIDPVLPPGLSRSWIVAVPCGRWSNSKLQKDTSGIGIPTTVVFWSRPHCRSHSGLPDGWKAGSSPDPTLSSAYTRRTARVGVSVLILD